jgi:hypothetical protein
VLPAGLIALGVIGLLGGFVIEAWPVMVVGIVVAAIGLLLVGSLL